MGFPSWNSLYNSVMTCEKCDLAGTRRNIVFGEGNPNADIMFIGEGPGRVEDETGRPFVGPAGRMLDDLLGGIGLKRDDVYIANIIKCRPPGNRDPLPQEIEACIPYVRGQLAFIKSPIIVGLGRYASGVLLGREVRITREHGTVHRIKSFTIIPTLHPAALLRNEDQIPMSQADFRTIREELDALREHRTAE